MVFNKPYSSSMEKEIQKAANIINSFFNNSTVDADSAIPAEMIKNCAGLAFLTVVKAGLVWTGKLGTGVVIARLDDGTWSAPSGIGTAGIGFGAEIGGEIIDFMIVLGSKGAVNTFKKGTQVSVGAGLELAVGPLGRAAGGAVNAGGGGLSANYTYSRAKGAFAGVGLHGSTILVRGEMNRKFYGRDVSPMEILSGHVQPPSGACDRLLEAISMAEGKDGVTVYPSTDPRSSSYNNSVAAAAAFGGNGPYVPSQPSASTSERHNSFESRASFNSSFNGSGSTASSSASTTRASLPAQPSGPDPRLSRFSSYKSEKELYEQYAKNKSSPGPAASPQNYGGSAYAVPAASTSAEYGGAPVATAVPAATAYGAASSGYGYAAAPATTAPATSYGGGYAAPAPAVSTSYGGGYGAPPAAASTSYGGAYGYAAPPGAAPPAPTSSYGGTPGYSAAPGASAAYGGAPGYSAPPTAAPAPPAPPAPAPTRLSFKTVPVTTYKPDYGTQTSSTSSSSSRAQAPPLPPPAVGAETKQVYTDVINFVSSKCPYANVQIFKDNCRLFGQDQMSLDAYMAYLTSICTTPLLKELIPQLVRLLPTQDKRDNLWTLYVREVLMIR